jgi:hypothetical protein
MSEEELDAEISRLLEKEQALKEHNQKLKD